MLYMLLRNLGKDVIVEGLIVEVVSDVIVEGLMAS